MGFQEERLLKRLITMVINMSHTVLKVERVDFLEQKMLIPDNEHGQSAIEFILTFAFALGVTFLFVNQALNLTTGYLAHYVNFMAARTYLVAEDGSLNESANLNTAQSEAILTFKSFGVEKVALDGVPEILPRNKASALFTGTIFQFKRKLSSLPIVGGGKEALFYSEAFLGKEPLRVNCAKMICAAMTGNQDACTDNTASDKVLYDNGC